MLIDTDVLIWYLKGNQKAYAVLESQSNFYISVISYMELVQGMRNKLELKALRQNLRRWPSRILYINEDISAKAMFYVEQHFLSHSINLGDALIGATAVMSGELLFTANDKHYKAIKEIEIEKFRP